VICQENRPPIIPEKKSFVMVFAYEMGVSSGHRSGHLLVQERTFTLAALAARL
jgi:hypothetical protein